MWWHLLISFTCLCQDCPIFSLHTIPLSIMLLVNQLLIGGGVGFLNSSSEMRFAIFYIFLIFLDKTKQILTVTAGARVGVETSRAAHGSSELTMHRSPQCSCLGYFAMVLGVGLESRENVFLFWGQRQKKLLAPTEFLFCWKWTRLTHWKPSALNKQSSGSFFVMAE